MKLSEKLLNKSNKDIEVFFMLLLLSAFLRFYKIDSEVPFFGDQGHDFLAARDMVLTGKIPLLGIASSVPRFHQGPIYVWFIGLIMSLSQFNPFTVIFFASFLGLIAVGLTYMLAERFFNHKIAFLASLVLATSAYAVAHSRTAFHTNAIPLVSVIYLWSLFRFLKKPNNLFWVSLSFALLFQFELVVAPLFLLIPLSMFLAKIRPKINHLIQILGGLILGLLPQIIYDLTHGFKQLGVFVVWIGYRLASFVGIYQEHTTSVSKISRVGELIFSYLQRYFFWQSPWVTGIILITLVVLIVTNIKKLNSYSVIVLSWILILLFSFFILGNASDAYFPAIFVPVALITAIAVNQIKNQYLQNLLIALIIVISAFNTKFLIQHSFLTGPAKPGNPLNTYGSSIGEQLNVSKLISQKQVKEVSLQTVGNRFPSYLDNYRYLLWWQYRIEDSKDGFPVWIYPISSTSQPANTVNYQFASTIISLPILR